MSRNTWQLIKESKMFYVHTYRKMSSFLIASIVLNLILGLFIHYTYLHRGSSSFYATDGMTPPVPLVPRDEPNDSPFSLLANEQESTNETKVIPQ